ncbi:MAG: DUF3883 domain-containing protein [Anaerolineaceae bacterium]|nr:DUF3883 domain-containing protein [Anaerolineaceae bacterium]
MSSEIIFPNLQGIKQLISLLNTTKIKKTEYLKRRFESTSKNFYETITFLEKLELIEVRSDSIECTYTFQKFVNFPNDKLKFQKAFLIQILQSKKQDFKIFNEYFSKFQLNEDKLVYKPTTKQRLQDSGVRNLLMELDIIEFMEFEKTYRISNEFQYFFIENKDKHSITPEEFEKRSKKQNKIGYLAELTILDYEKNRLNSKLNIIHSIIHVALENISAGYDILSYEMDNKGSIFIERHIEVKAVSIIDYKFYWSRNEIETAKIDGLQYYLYLLPVVGNSKFDINNLKIIPNAFENVFLKNKEWNKQEELFSFWKMN